MERATVTVTGCVLLALGIIKSVDRCVSTQYRSSICSLAHEKWAHVPETNGTRRTNVHATLTSGPVLLLFLPFVLVRLLLASHYESTFFFPMRETVSLSLSLFLLTLLHLSSPSDQAP